MFVNTIHASTQRLILTEQSSEPKKKEAEQWSAVAKETSWQYQTTQLNIVGEKITQSVLPQKLAFACSVPCTPMNAPELKVQHRGCSHLLTSNGNNTAKHTPLIYYPHTGILALKLINRLIKTLMLLVFFKMKRLQFVYLNFQWMVWHTV